jgi:hypothetical protein
MPIRPTTEKATVASWGVFVQFFQKNVVDPFKNYLANKRQATVQAAPGVISDASKELQPILDTIKLIFEDTGATMEAGLEPTFGALAAKIFNLAAANLEKNGLSTPDTAVAEAAAAYSQAFAFGMSSAAVTALFELAVPEKLNTLNGVGPMLAKMAGFDEVAAAVREPLYKAAFGKSLEYYFNSQFKPDFANERDATVWHSRRLLSDDDLREVFQWSGLKAKYEDAYVGSAYRAVQPRALASMIQDIPFPTAQMTDLLQFAGLRDQDITLMLSLMETNSLKNVRQAYLAANVAAAEEGIISADQLTSAMTDLNFSTDAQNLVQLTVAVKKLQQLAELYRKSVTELYKTAQLTDAQYVPALEAIGIAEADANAHYAIDSAYVHGKALAAAARAAAKEEAAQIRAAVASARANYFAGNLDAPAFAAALAASGLDPNVIPAAISLAAAQLQGRQRNVYGAMVSPDKAVLLREKVADLGKQVAGGLVTPAAALDALASEGIPDANAQALVAGWAATKTPAADVGVLLNT